MEVIVTGAAGFIGSHLVDRLLDEGHLVSGVDDFSSGRRENLRQAMQEGTRFQLHELDICSPQLRQLVEKSSPEVIFHLAAQVDVHASEADPVHDASVNIVGTVNVLEAARRAGSRKVVFAASGGTLYGERSPSELPTPEALASSADVVPRSPYGVSKKIVLDYLRHYRDVHEIEFAALALANVYGPRQEPATEVALEGKVVAIFCRQLLQGKKCVIYGDGTQTRDFVYVGDVVNAFLAAVRRGDGLINIGTGKECSINELYAQIRSLCGSHLEPSYRPPRTGDVHRSVLDTTKAERLLGWAARAQLEEGLRTTLEWDRATSWRVGT